MELGNIGMTLKDLRLEKGVTLEEVAQSIGSSKSLLSKYERGVHEPGLTPLSNLCAYYNVSLDWLIMRR